MKMTEGYSARVTQYVQMVFAFVQAGNKLSMVPALLSTHRVNILITFHFLLNSQNQKFLKILTEVKSNAFLLLKN